MENKVKIIIDNIKNDGFIKFNKQQIQLNVNNKTKIIDYKNIIGIKKYDNRNISILLTNKQIITIKSNDDINNLNDFYKWKSFKDKSIKINSSTFRRIYIYNHPISILLIMSMILTIVYSGLIGVSLADSLEIHPIVAFFSGIIFGVKEYPIDLIQIILYSLMAICIILETLLYFKCEKNVESILNNIYIEKEEQINHIYSDLEKLKELLDKNVLTQEEFDIKKKEILNIKDN